MSKRTHDVSDELLSSLLANYKKPDDRIGENGLLKQLTKRLVEKALDAEMTEHPGHDRQAAATAAHFTGQPVRQGVLDATTQCMYEQGMEFFWSMIRDTPVSVVHTETAHEIRIISFRKATRREAEIHIHAIQN